MERELSNPRSELERLLARVLEQEDEDDACHMLESATEMLADVRDTLSRVLSVATS